MPKTNEKVVYTNSTDKQYMLEKRRKIKLERRIKSNAWILRLLFVALFVGYVLSDYSKIMSISIYGNKAVSKEAVLELAGLDQDSFYYLYVPTYLEYKIKSNPLIKRAEVSRKGNNIVRIDIEERNVVATVIGDEGLEYVINDGSLISVDKSNIDYIKDVPFISGLEENPTLLKLLAENMSGVNDNILLMISEIVWYPMPYDETQLKIHMVDHNIVYVPIYYISSINDYPKIVNALSKNNVCVYFDSPSTKPYIGECISNVEEVPVEEADKVTDSKTEGVGKDESQ